ncbi:MAG TPA: hypothetical protein VGO76_03205 [Luteibacter sp.]|nr:hypothetical protein [Luteibacter sp.]
MITQDILGIAEIGVIFLLFSSGLIYYYFLFRFADAAKAKDIVIWNDVRDSFISAQASDFGVSHKLISKKELSDKLESLGCPSTRYARLAKIWLYVALSTLAVVFSVGLYFSVNK